MPDVREVFQMTTQKVRPDKDFMDRQDSRQRRRMRNQKVGAFAMVAAIAAIAVIAIAQVRNGEDPLVPASPASPSGTAFITNWYFDIASGERSQLAASLPSAKLLEVSPDQQNVVYGTCCGRDALTVAALDGSESKTITPDALDGYAATWIDNETILFQGRTSGTSEIGDLYVANISTGELTMVVDLPDMRHGAWIIRSDLSPDGRTVLFHLPRGAGDNTGYDLWTAPLAGGVATLLREDAGFATYVPDGRIVFLDGPRPFYSLSMSIMDGDGKNARVLEGDGTFIGKFSWPQVSPDGTKIAYGDLSADECVEQAVGIADLATGDSTILDTCSEDPAWYGNDTLIVD